MLKIRLARRRSGPRAMSARALLAAVAVVLFGLILSGAGCGLLDQIGIMLNRTCGVAFETGVLKTEGFLPRWTTLIPSKGPRRCN